jgi:hypothetical protein
MYGPFGLPELLSLVIAAGGLFWLWMLVDCARHEESEHRVRWILILLFTNIIGALVYFFSRKRRRNQKSAG